MKNNIVIFGLVFFSSYLWGQNTKGPVKSASIPITIEWVDNLSVNTAFSTDLDKLVQFLKDNTETKLEIQGHTDNTGSLKPNNQISQTRANSIVDYLVKNGIDGRRISAKGFGPSLPVASNTTAEGRAKNRRVVIKVIQ